MQLSGDLSPVDEVNSIGIEASSDSAFGTFGWEFGILRGDDDFSASDSVSGERVQGDLSLTEIYGGARKTFDLQAVKAHVGLGLSYVNLDVDAQRSLPGGGGGGASPFNVQSLQDGSIGAYAQAGLSVPIGSAFTVGLTGRVRGGEDFEDGGNSVGSAISSFALRFSVRR